MIPFPRPALPFGACPWTGAPPEDVETAVAEDVERERHAHGGGPRVVTTEEAK